MRRLTPRLKVAATVLMTIAVPAGCNRERPRGETIEESSSNLASIVHVADPATATQLIRGFHSVEQNAWRWTKGEFSVALRPPAQAAQKGARLVLRFSVPPPVLQRLSEVSISAKVEGTVLPGERYTQAGDLVYRQDVPASVLSGATAIVDFALDRTLPPGTLDQRELGIVVSSIGFEAR